MTALVQAVLLSGSQHGGERIQLLKLEGGDSSFVRSPAVLRRGCWCWGSLLLLAACSCSPEQMFAGSLT